MYESTENTIYNCKLCYNEKCGGAYDCIDDAFGSDCMKDDVLFYIAVLGFSGTVINLLLNTASNLYIAPITRRLDELEDRVDDCERKVDTVEHQSIRNEDNIKSAHKRIAELRRLHDKSE